MAQPIVMPSTVLPNSDPTRPRPSIMRAAAPIRPEAAPEHPTRAQSALPASGAYPSAATTPQARKNSRKTPDPRAPRPISRATGAPKARVTVALVRTCNQLACVN